MSQYTREQVIEMVTKGESLEGADLSGIDLSGIDFRIEIFNGPGNKYSFKGADLRGVDFRKANLNEANLNRAALNMANLSGANLKETALIEADLNMANLSEAELTKAHIHNANLIKANLCGANLTEADLTGASLVGANLSEANLSGAKLKYTKLSYANLREANFFMVDLDCANLQGADFRGTDLSEANLSEAKLNGTKLCEAIFSDTNLSKTEFGGANFSSAIFNRTDLSGADLGNADFNLAKLTATNLCDTNLRSTDFENAHLEEIDISGANIHHLKTHGWNIKNIKCTHVFQYGGMGLWKNEKEREKYRRDFEPGEFEALYRTLPVIELIFQKGFTPQDLSILTAMIEQINQRLPSPINMSELKSGLNPTVSLSAENKDTLEEAIPLIQQMYQKLEEKNEQVLKLTYEKMQLEQRLSEIAEYNPVLPKNIPEPQKISQKPIIYYDNRRYYFGSADGDHRVLIDNRQTTAIINNFLDHLDSPDFKDAELIEANNEFQKHYDSLGPQQQAEMKKQAEEIVAEKTKKPGFKEKLKKCTKWAAKEGWEVSKNVLINILSEAAKGR